MDFDLIFDCGDESLPECPEFFKSPAASLPDASLADPAVSVASSTFEKTCPEPPATFSILPDASLADPRKKAVAIASERLKRRETTERRTLKRRRPLQRYYERSRVHRHTHVEVALAITSDSYTLTNGVESYCVDDDEGWKEMLSKDLETVRASLVYAVDSNTYGALKKMSRKFGHLYKVVRLDRLAYIDVCHYCQKRCHRWKAVVGGAQHFLKYPVRPIPH